MSTAPYDQRPVRIRRSQDGLQLRFALILSVLFHAPILWVFSILVENHGGQTINTDFDSRKELRLELLEEPHVPKRNKEKKLTFVSQPKPEVEERPDTARFADQYDSVAARETVKKGAPGKNSQQMKQPPLPLNRMQPPRQPQKDKEQPRDENQPQSWEDENGSQATKLVDTPLDAAPSDTASKQVVPQDNPRLLFPNFRTADAAKTDATGSIDYLRDVAEGDKTMLNRKKSRYWSFFDRIKVEIAKQWSPVTEYRKRDPHGDVYGVKDRYSTVRVTLNGNGSVRHLVIARDSGLEFFDAEAIRSIRAASPFHNPPEGLKDQDGLVHFTFGFYFEITSGQFRFRRMRR